MSPPITLRPISDEDRDFVYHLFAINTAIQMGALNWDGSQRDPLIDMQFRGQELHYRTHYPDAEQQLVLCEERPVGRLILMRTDESIHLCDIALLPQYQHQGIGTRVIGQLQEEAKAKSLPITAHVNMMNPAVHFYQKLGFTISPGPPPQYVAEWKGDPD